MARHGGGRAGDTIIVRTLEADSLRSTIGLREELAIGVTEGDDAYTFGEITLLAVAPDGTIYAYDRQVPALRAYGTDGRYLRSIGAEGSGPGEYRMAQGLTVSADGQVMLYDPANARVNVYDADGQPRGEWRFVSTVPPLRTDPSWRWSGSPFPRDKPFMRRLQPAEDARFWVLLHQPSLRQQEPARNGGFRVFFTEPTVYDVFESDGVYLGPIRLPARTALFVMRDNHVWAVTRDSLDVQSIRRYRLDPPPAYN